jgi:tyrosinase
MTNATTTRREFLGRAGAAAAVSTFGLGARAVGQKARDGVYVRREINTLALDGPEISAFRKGVEVMKRRPASDTTSWIYQANIHGTYDKPVLPAWNTCQHGNYFFAPWHRMYLYYFERILRAASGDPNFALPYWNYTNPTNRALPLALRQPADESNSLFVRQRNQHWGGLNNGAKLPGSATANWLHLSFTNYTAPAGTMGSFGGQAIPDTVHYDDPHGALEAWHDIIHVITGGEGGWMNDPNIAGRDPIFWLHHNNVDRLWKRWLEQGGGRANPVQDAHWMNQKFPFFDENGRPVEMSSKDVIETEAQLGYRFDDDPPELTRPPVPPAPLGPAAGPLRPQKILGESTEPRIARLGLEPVVVTIPLNAAARQEISRAVEAQAPLFLNVVDVSHEQEPGVYFEVYINLPEDAKEFDYQDVHFLSTFSFIGLKPTARPANMTPHGDKQPDAGSRTFFVTDTIRELKERKLWNDEKMTVTIVMRGLVPVNEKVAYTKPSIKARFRNVNIARA